MVCICRESGYDSWTDGNSGCGAGVLRALFEAVVPGVLLYARAWGVLGVMQGPVWVRVAPGPRDDATLWAVEGLRGLAAFMVMWWHFRHWVIETRAPDAFGYTGVDLFFVLSGFVFAPYVFGKPLAIWPYVVRRVLRIYPLYLVSLLLYMFLRQSQGADPWRYVWQHVLMLHTSVSRDVAAYYNGAYWSLPVEVEFYALVPLLAWLVARGRWWFGVVLASALALHLALSLWAVPGQAPMPLVLANVHLPGLLAEFLLGCLAWRAARVPGVLRWAHWILGLAAVLWLTAAMVWVAVGDVGVMAHPLLRGNMGYWAAVAYGLVMCVVGARMMQASSGTTTIRITGKVPLRTRLLVGLSLLGGQLSYGVYLLHNAGQEVSVMWWPGLSGWTRVGAAAGLTVAAAWLLHQVVEAPARAWGRKRAGGGILQAAGPTAAER